MLTASNDWPALELNIGRGREVRCKIVAYQRLEQPQYGIRDVRAVGRWRSNRTIPVCQLNFSI